MTAATGPAARALAEAERRNAELGHENLGALSESHGFLARRPPTHDLPPPFDAWVDAVDELPELIRSLRLRPRLDELPALDASAESLDERHLMRAASVLGLLVHAYANVPMRAPERLPEPLVRPWLQTAERLGRPAFTLTNSDYIFDNWQLVDAHAPDPMRAENLRLLNAIWDHPGMAQFILVLVELLARSAPLAGAAVRAQEACLRDDDERLTAELALMSETVASLTHESLPKIGAAGDDASRIDPVVWTKLFAMVPLPVPGAPEDVRNASGAETPYFHLLDVVLGRREYATGLGEEALRFRALHPRHWRDFLAAVGDVSIAEHVRGRADRALTDAFAELADRYQGPQGLLARHRLKAFGYMDTAFKTGRSSTVTGFSGVFEDRPWETVDASFEAARVEREESVADLVAAGDAGARGSTVVVPPPFALPSGFPVPDPAQRREIDPSELARHNEPGAGLWMAIGGRVYDLTAFAAWHPGGAKLIQSFAGIDATASYRMVGHHLDPAIESQLAPLEIGTLAEADPAWLRPLYVLVELQNAHRLDWSIQDEPLHREELGGAITTTPYRLQFAVESLQRFAGQTVPFVRRVLAALPNGSAGELESPPGGEEARAALEQDLERDGPTPALETRIAELRAGDERYLAAAKDLVIAGMRDVEPGSE